MSSTSLFAFILMLLSPVVYGANIQETCAVPVVEKINIDDVKRLTSHPCQFSFEKLIESLPAGMKESVVLMKKSASLVRTCVDEKDQNLRIIYSAPHLVLAFPWKATKDDSCKIVEAIGPSKGTPGLNPTLIDYRSGKGSIDGSGRHCVGCHGESFKPLWENYAIWKTEKNESMGFADDVILVGSTEYETFKKFINNVQVQNKMSWFGSRFQSFVKQTHYLESELIKTPPTNDVFFTSHIQTLNLPYVFVLNEKDKPKSLDLLARPGLRLGKILGDFNSERLSEQIYSKIPEKEIVNMIIESGACEGNNLLNIMLPLLKHIGLEADQLQMTIDTHQKTYFDGTEKSEQSVLKALMRKLVPSFAKHPYLQSAYDLYYVKPIASVEERFTIVCREVMDVLSRKYPQVLQ
ncbi:MAG: hypothetical protein AB7F59_11265 [Bdellovibrionales bacterium]